MTLLDVLIAILTVAVLAALILPVLTKSKRGPRYNCVSNLKQIGLSFRMWSNDHDDRMPMSVSTNSGGSKEFNGDVVHHFLAITNELWSPKVLTCSSDTNAKLVADFARLTTKNVSYFLGLDADLAKPQMLLSGDRNITNDLPLTNHIMQLPSLTPVRWTESIHHLGGNVGLVDGSVGRSTTTLLQRQLSDPMNATNCLAIP